MNDMSNELYHNRKVSRAQWHDYMGGLYFITICTARKRHFFGEISKGVMTLNILGDYCHQLLIDLPGHYSNVSVPLFVVMPNHVHFIVEICSKHHSVCEPIVASVPQRSALSIFVGGFKREVTYFAHQHDIEFGWQGRFYDHIIRGVEDGNNISDYITNNVARWDSDCFNSFENSSAHL